MFSHCTVFLPFVFSSAAYSYPIATLSRTMNPYTNNILEYVSFTYRVLEKALGGVGGLPKPVGAISVAATQAMLNQQTVGISRRVGRQVFTLLHHQMLDSSSSRC